MALIFCFKGAGGCRWLMHDDMLGFFILWKSWPKNPGCPGQSRGCPGQSLGCPGQSPGCPAGHMSGLSGPHVRAVHAWVRVAREAVGPEGQVVPQQWLAHTTAPGVPPQDRRRLDLVVYGATTRDGALCCDATLVSPHKDRSPSALRRPS